MGVEGGVIVTLSGIGGRGLWFRPPRYIVC